MIHRQPAPARGWPRWMFGIRTSNEWPYGRVAAGCRRYARYVNGIRNVAAMIHRQPAPARGWPPWDVTNTNVQRVALRPGGGRLPPLRPVRKRYTQCSGDDSSPSSPARGWPRGMLRIRMFNEWPYGRVVAGCRRYDRYVNGIRNVAAMIHRHPAPARDWPRWMFGIRTSNEWPYGQVAAGCRRYIRYV